MMGCIYRRGFIIHCNLNTELHTKSKKKKLLTLGNLTQVGNILQESFDVI